MVEKDMENLIANFPAPSLIQALSLYVSKNV